MYIVWAQYKENGEYDGEWSGDRHETRLAAEKEMREAEAEDYFKIFYFYIREV